MSIIRSDIIKSMGIHFALIIIFIVLIAFRVDPLLDSLDRQRLAMEEYTLRISGLGDIDPEDDEALLLFTESVQNSDALRRAQNSFNLQVFIIFLLFTIALSLLLPITYAKEKYWQLAGSFALVTLALVGIAFIYFIIASIIAAKAGFVETSGGVMVLVFLIILSVLIVAYPIVARWILGKKQHSKFTFQVHILTILLLAAVSAFMIIILPPVAQYFQYERTLMALFWFILVLVLIFGLYSFVLSYEKRALLTGKLFK